MVDTALQVIDNQVSPAIIDISLNNQTSNDMQERDDDIVYQVLIKGVQQIDLAKQYDISKERISQIVKRYMQDEGVQKRLNQRYKKQLSALTMKHAVNIAETLDITKISDNSKVTNMAILIDKSLLLSGDNSGNQSPQINIVNYGDITVK